MNEIVKLFKSIKKECLLVCFIAVIVIFITFMGSTGIPMIQKVIRVLYPLWVALIFAYIINMPMKRMEDFIDKHNVPKWLKKYHRSICLTLSTIIILGIITILICVIIPQVFTSISNLFKNLTNTINYLINNINIILDFLHLDPIEMDQDTSFYIKWFQDQGWSYEKVLNQISTLAADSSETIFNYISSFATQSLQIFMGFLLSLYLVADKEKFIRQGKKIIAFLLPAYPAMFIECLLRDVNEIFANYTAGQLIEAVIFAILCYIGMVIFKFPMPMLVSCVVAVLCIIPMFGPTLGMIFGAIIVLSTRPLLQCIAFCVYYQVLQQLENNLIYPYVVGTKVGLPAIWVLLAITVFGSLYGIVGMLLAVPITAVLYNFLSVFINYELRKRKISVSERCISYEKDKIINK